MSEELHKEIQGLRAALHWCLRDAYWLNLMHPPAEIEITLKKERDILLGHVPSPSYVTSPAFTNAPGKNEHHCSYIPPSAGSTAGITRSYVNPHVVYSVSAVAGSGGSGGNGGHCQVVSNKF